MEANSILRAAVGMRKTAEIAKITEKNLVLYASPGEKGRKKKVKIVQYPGRAGKGSFYK